MINKLYLDNFKCFRSLELNFGSLNVLTGINGMGKSTIIQSLLLLCQSSDDIERKGQIRLDGELISLGTGRDILCEYADADEIIKIGLCSNDEMFEYTMEYSPYSDTLPLVKSTGNLPRFITDGQYVFLSAFRIPLVNIYPITNKKNLDRRQFGNDGVYALQYLKEYGPNELPDELVYPDQKYTNTLADQVRYWMDKIVPGVTIEIDIDPEKQLASLGYAFIEGKNVTNTYKSVNVGFGITYVLPIVVALLSAKSGDVIMLENPEAHIHPSGQRKLGELMAWVCRNGVQIIVETHSDHILNGIRLAVKNRTIRKELTSIFYFYKDNADNYQHKVEKPVIHEDGRMSCWPKGFFDEWDNALLDLL